MTSRSTSRARKKPEPEPESSQRVVEYTASAAQLRVLQSRKRRIFFGAGLGSGKTEIGGLWALTRAKASPPGVLAMVAANTYSQLIDSTLRPFYENLEKWGIPVRPGRLPRGHAAFSVEVWIGNGWRELICRSLDNYENLSGVKLGWWWIDEAWQTERAAIDVVFARDRDTRMPINQGLITTTLDDPGSWMYGLFVDKYDDGLMEVVYAPTHTNEQNLPAGYIDGLRQSLDPKSFQRMVLAKWVSLAGGQIYYAFDRGIHVQAHADFHPENGPIMWAHDFNIGQGKPMSSVLCQTRKAPSKWGWRRELVVFDEIVLESSDTQDAVREFKSRGWHLKLPDRSRVVIYGDASGHSHDTRSRTSDYQIIRAAGFTAQRVPYSNPPIRDRHNAVNALLKNAQGDVRLHVHPRCKTVAKGLETVILKSGAQYLEKETKEQHVTTALGYLVCEEFPATGRAGGSMASPI